MLKFSFSSPFSHVQFFRHISKFSQLFPHPSLLFFIVNLPQLTYSSSYLQFVVSFAFSNIFFEYSSSRRKKKKPTRHGLHVCTRLLKLRFSCNLLPIRSLGRNLPLFRLLSFSSRKKKRVFLFVL